MSPTKQDDETAKGSTTPDFLKGIDISPEEERQMEDAAYSGAAEDIAAREGLSGDKLKGAEESGVSKSKASKSEKQELDQVGQGYNEETPGRIGRVGRNMRTKWSGMSGRKKSAIATATGLGLTGAVVSIFGLFSLFGIFRLDAFLNGIESRAFTRYQVSMEDRSSKWIVAYLALRLAEVEDPNKTPGNRDNILFRSKRVDNNKPLTDWYRTLRTSKFETEVFEKNGITFQSNAIWNPDRKIVEFRTVKITIKDQDLELRGFTQAELDKIMNNDFSGFSLEDERLNQYFDITDRLIDREARKELKQHVKNHTKPYQFIKRYYIRKNIQNQTGIRDWKFFEKTRNEWQETRTSVRNKMVAKMLPDSTRMGRIAQCLTGAGKCSGNTDPNNPDNQSDAARGVATTGLVDANSPESPDKIQEAILKSLNLGGRIAGPVGVILLIDMLDNINTGIENGALQNAVTSAKSAQAIGLYTQFGIARDQIHTGEVNEAEVGEFMQLIDGAGQSEGWSSVVAGNNVEGGEEKKKQCDPQTRSKIDGTDGTQNPEGGVIYHCPQDMIGGADRAETVETVWNNSIGFVLQPVFSVYHGVPGLKALVTKGAEIASALITPVINKILEVSTLGDDFEKFAKWALDSAMSMLGAGPLFASNAPDAIWTNHTIQGAAATAESQMRFSGGALSSASTMEDSNQDVLAYVSEEKSSQSYFKKYFSPSNPRSLVGNAMFEASSKKTPVSYASAIFGSLFSVSNIFTGHRAGAATSLDPYAAAKFGGVKTYDLPAVCKNSQPLTASPESQTNADDMGLINQADLSWELLRDSNGFYSKLYQDNPDRIGEIEQVYNCAIADSMAQGGLSGKYAPENAGPNALKSNTGTVATSASNFTLATMNVQHETAPDTPAHCRAYEALPDNLRQCAEFRAKLTMEVIKGTTAVGNPALDIVGMQELDQTQHRIFKTQLSGYGISPTEISEHRGTGIVWNTAKFSKVKEGAFPFYDNVGDPRNVPWVELQTGSQKVLAISVHFPNDNYRGDGFRDKMANMARDWAKQRIAESPGLMVVIMGDFNEGITSDTSVYCTLTRGGILQNALDMAQGKNPSTPCPPKDRSYFIDHIYSNPLPGIAALDWTSPPSQYPLNVIAKKHVPVYVTYKLPSLASDQTPTSQDGWVWPTLPDQKITNGNCFDVGVGGLGSHAGMDINTPLTNLKVLAMSNGTVVKSGTDGAAGNYLMIKADDGTYYAYQHLKDRPTVSGRVNAGQVVGIAGKTGRVFLASSAAHLHITMATTATLGAYGNHPDNFDPMKKLAGVKPGGYNCTQ